MKEITVQVGETLSDIALREFGDASLWPRLLEANPDHFQSERVRQMMRRFSRYRAEDCIFPGQTLRVPTLTPPAPTL